MFSFSKNHIRKADIFGVRPELFIQQKKIFKSLNGGFLTIFLLLSFTGIVAFYFVKYIHGEKANLFERDLFSENSGQIKMGPQHLTFAMGFSNTTLNNLYKNKKFFNIRVHLRENIRNYNETKLFRNFTEIPMDLCK